MVYRSKEPLRLELSNRRVSCLVTRTSTALTFWFCTPRVPMAQTKKQTTSNVRTMRTRMTSFGRGILNSQNG
ncbi:hypothetical protein JMJ77_0008022 [Colletotrichum scovillei]|uniref:Uncharacterized protein n=1 Tax=Colletotrichum scovillei TaxID=1209932 RepID=A0A9P7UJC2_9PEZI|nr:hypothetical protein JMJ77_0008022 [Colletotrichum scovillei]KAG7075011.1 hypothetical protein JMJ76_0011475 [Colletotrichum scovillei]KAG7082397.1 hypothetical protein JMJ78_0004499 [Colletotrichum scovillei]